MGNCSSDQSDMIIKDKGNKDDTLNFIRSNLKEIEEIIIKLRKDDVHYRMTKLMFLFNSMTEVEHWIKFVEENENLNYSETKDYFGEMFENLKSYEREKFSNSIKNLKNYLEVGNNQNKLNSITPNGITPK